MEDGRMASKAKPYIDISDHAVDRASQRCLGLWEETALPGEGLLTWLRRTAREALALAAGQEPADKGLCHMGMRYVLRRADSNSFNLVTVINDGPSFPGCAPGPALGKAFLEWVATGVQTGQLDCGEGADVQMAPGGILLRYPGLFRAFGQLHDAGTKRVKDSFLLLGLHVPGPQGDAFHRLSLKNHGTPACGIIVRDASALLGEAKLPPVAKMRPGPADAPQQEATDLHLTACQDADGGWTLRKDGQAVHGIPEAWLDTILLDGPAPARAEVPKPPPPAALGRAFLGWVAAGVRSGDLRCNGAGARIHVVPEGVLLASPGIFQDYAEASGGADFGKVQESFLRLRLHRRTAAGLNIHRYGFSGHGASLCGLLLPNPGILFGDGATPAPSLLLKRSSSLVRAFGTHPNSQKPAGQAPLDALLPDGATLPGGPAAIAMEPAIPEPAAEVPAETGAEQAVRHASGEPMPNPVREEMERRLPSIFESIARRRHAEVHPLPAGVPMYRFGRKHKSQAYPLAGRDARVLACLCGKADWAAQEPAKTSVALVAGETRLTVPATLDALKRLRSYGLVNWKGCQTGAGKPIRFVFCTQNIFRLARRKEIDALALSIRGRPAPPEHPVPAASKADPLLAPRLKRDWQGLWVRLREDVQAFSQGSPGGILQAGTLMVVDSHARGQGFTLRRGNTRVFRVDESMMEIIHPQPLPDKPPPLDGAPALAARARWRRAALR